METAIASSQQAWTSTGGLQSQRNGAAQHSLRVWIMVRIRIAVALAAEWSRECDKLRLMRVQVSISSRMSHRPRLGLFMIMGLYRNEFSCGVSEEERALVRRFTFQPYLSDDLISNADSVRVMQSPQPHLNSHFNVKAPGRTCPTSIGTPGDLPP